MTETGNTLPSPESIPDSTALWSALTAEQRTLLLRAARVATETGGAAYLVGGPVRDLVRGDPHLHDIDIVTTVDARSVAARFAAEDDAELAKTTEFGTATVKLRTMADATMAIDIATARTETYPSPGALPVVAFPASIDADLYRRDITINAMALPITSDGFGQLLDLTHGLADLRTGTIRVLHDASFRDDPTRLFRVARYAARFGFTIEPHTAALLDDASTGGALTTISADRKRHELEIGMMEPDAVACFAMFNQHGLLTATSPTLQWDAWVARRMRLIVPQIWPMWAFFVARQHEDATGRLFSDLAIVSMRDRIRQLVRVWHQRETIARATRVSDLVPLLDTLDPRAVQVVLDGEPSAAKAAAYSAQLQQIEHQDGNWGISFGTYLKELGVPPGPVYTETLTALRNARLDGVIDRLASAKAFVEQYVREHNDAPSHADRSDP